MFMVLSLIVLGGVTAKNLSASFDLDIGGDGDFGLDLGLGDNNISIGGGGEKKQPGCGESNCLSVPDSDEYGNIAVTGSFREAIIKWTNFFLGFLGLVAMIALIFAGFLYVTSLGNEEQAKKAKNIIVWVVLGIVVILVAFAMVNTLITDGPTGSDLPET